MQVHLVSRSLRLVTIMAVAAAAVMTITAASASAFTTARARTAAHAVTAHTVTSPATKAKKTRASERRAPGGCNNYNFCEYNSGNGGNLCFQTRNNQNFPGACADHNEGEYNRRSSAVYMYSQSDYHGCDYLLYSGHYLLYNAKDHFQGPNQSCRDETLEHRLVSEKGV